MGEEFHALIKLISGEEILSIVSVDDNDGNPIIVLQSPVTMKMMNTNNGSFVKVKPWIELADDNMFILNNDKIITMTEANDPKIIAIYEKYLEDESSETISFGKQGKVTVSNEMGYVSSVSEARILFEKLFNSTNKES